MRLWHGALVAGAIVWVCGAARVARADQLTELPVVPDAPSYSARIKENLSMMSLELNQHLGKLSGSIVGLKLDVADRTGEFHLGGGDERFGLRLDSDIKFERGYATFSATLDLAINGETYQLELPDFDMVPRSLEGERFVEVRLPLIKGEF
jgi:hypothetical protein